MFREVLLLLKVGLIMMALALAAVVETDNGGAILFEWQGLAVLSASGMRQLLGSLVPTDLDSTS